MKRLLQWLFSGGVDRVSIRSEAIEIAELGAKHRCVGEAFVFNRNGRTLEDFRRFLRMERALRRRREGKWISPY
jgi:hypothetical protein